MLSDKLKTAKSPKPRKKNDTVRRWYSDSQKLEAVKLWLLTGNMPVVAASLNIPLPTIKEWRYSKWWDEVVAEIKSEKTLQMSNKLKAVAEKALDITLDRLENGDFIYDQKTGQIVRKPVVMRDAMQVANSFMDRHLVLEKKPLEEKAQQQVQDRLLALADAFASMAKKTKRIEVVDAIYDERQEGLQERIGVGTQEEALTIEGSCEESSSSESGGEEDGESSVKYARGSQESPDGSGIELSVESEGSVSQNQSI